MSYLGDLASGSTTLDLKFTTVTVSGVPTTFSGTPVVSVYRSNTTAETTVGLTLTTDFDARTGLNHIRLILTDAYYSTGADYQFVVTTGTAGGNSIVGYVVGEFSIDNRTMTRTQLNQIWDETSASHTTAATFGLFLDTAISSRATVNAIWNETVASHVTANTFGLFVDTAISGRATVNAIWNETVASHVTAGTFGLFVDTTISSRATVNAIWNETQASHVTAGTFGLFLNGDVNTVDTVSLGAITNTSFAAGAIDAAAIAADAIGSSELAATAANEIADALLARNVAGGSSTGRIVSEALYVLRNKVDITGGNMLVYQTDDVTTSWTAAVTTTAAVSLITVDPT